MNNAPASCGAEGREVRRSNSPARTNSPLGCSARRGTAKQVPSGKLAADLSALGSSTAEVAQPCVPAIELREVSFSYGKEPFIGGLSAMFSHGAVTSIVGPNGCGKSTMVKLVDGLLRPQAGEVRVGGVPTLSLKAKARARRVAVLAQASRPPAMTVEALVACGRYPYQARQGRLSREDREQVECALELASVARFRDCKLRRLSGGERQRLSIARAILRDAPIVLLDEATASLDIENELAVKEAIANLLAKRKTVVMVAHTLAIVRGADSIAVVGDGRVLEQGTHDELVAAGGKYARMWAADRELA